MLDEMGPYAPNGIGRTEFAECLRHLHDEHKGIALAHIRRALKAEPQNPFFLSYVGMLCAVAEKRYVAGEKLCREALEIKCNHAQLYLNLAEVYRHAGRHGDAEFADLNFLWNPDDHKCAVLSAQSSVIKSQFCALGTVHC